MDDNLKKVWQTLSEDYELPDYDTFKEDMKDEENLRSLWTNAKKNYDLPDYDQFKADMGFGDEDSDDDIATNGTLPANALEEEQRKQGVLPAEDVKQYGTVSAAERRNPQMFQQPEPRKPMTEEDAFAAEVQSLNPETPQGYAVNEQNQRVKTHHTDEVVGQDEQGNPIYKVEYDKPESRGYYQTKESELSSRSRRPNQFGEVYFGWREGERVKQLDTKGSDLASRTGHKGDETYRQVMDKAETMSDAQLIAQYNAWSKQITDASFEAGTAEGAELASALKAIQHELHARDLGYSHDRDVPYQGEADYRSAMQDEGVRNTAAKLEKMDNQTRLIVAGKAYARMLDGGDAEDENIMMAMAALYARDRKMDISDAYNAVIDETGVMQSQMQSDLDMIYQQESDKQKAMGDSAAAVGVNQLPGADPLQDYAAATEAIIQRRSAGGGMRGMLNRMTSRALSESSAFKAYYNRMYAQHIKEGMSKVRAQQMAANDVRNVFRDREVQRTMPTTDTTFVLGSTLKDNMLAQMWDAGVALASGDYEGSRVVDEAYQVYSDTKAGTFANIQASAYPMAVDIASGMFAPANAAGEFVAKNVITRPLVAFAERAIGIGEKELMRRLASNLTYRTITGMTRTGVSLGVFGSTSALVRGARYGDVNGREIASSGWHMFKDGIWFGVGNTFMGKAVEGLTGAKALAGEAGVIAGETALFTALDVINTPDFDWNNIDKTIGRSLGVTLAGRIGKPAEWAHGLAARVSGTMKGSPITEAQTLNKETRRELEGSYPTICRLMSNASLAKDLAKGMTRGKYHYNESGEVDAVATANRLEREWNQMKEDKNVPYEVKRKVDYVLNGELSPRPAIANFRLSDEGEDGTSYGETLDINGNVITRHKFKNDKERKAFEKEVSLEAERNRLALEEQSINMSHLAIIQDRAAAVKATAMGVEKKAVDDILDKQAKGEKLTKEEQEVVRDVVRLRDRAVEKNSATDQIKREVRERTGLDVDDIVKTPVLDRTPTQHKVLEEYEQRLRGEWDETQDMSDAEVVGHQKDQSQQEGREATDEDKHRMQVEYEQARAEVERIGFDPRDIDRRDDEQLAFLLNNSDIEPEDAAAVMAYVNAKAMYDSMIGKVREDMAEAVRQNEAEVDERTNKTDGKITTVTLKMGDKQMHVVGGRVVGNEDGTINTRESSGYIIVRDPQTGEKKSVSPQDIRTVGESLDAQQVKNDSNTAIREKMATEQGHIIDGDIPFEAGQEYMLQDTEGKDFPIRIEQVDGETVYYTEGGDPTVYSRSRDELQGWIRAAEEARQQPQQDRGETPAQETRPAEREQRPATPVAEERPAPARMPMTKDNKPDWENSTPEQAREYLRDLGEEDVTAIIDSERKKASDAAEKALADGDVEGLKRARRMQRYWDEVDQLRRQAEQPAEPEPIVEPMDKSEMLSPEDAPRDIEAENDMRPVEEPMGEDAVASLNAGMSEEERETWVDTPEEVVDMLDSVAKSLGLTVRSESLPANVNGYQDGDVLVVNKDRGSNERVAFVMGHEMTHKLERESDEKGLATYDTFKDAALDMQRRIKEQAGEDYEEYIEGLIQLYRDHHADEGYKKAKAAGMSDEQALAQAAIEEAKVDRAFVEREVAADMAGRMADKPELVRDLFNQIEEPTLMQRIKNWLVDFVNAIRGNEFVPVGDEEHWAYLADKYNQLFNEVVESRKRVETEFGERFEGEDGNVSGAKHSLSAIFEGNGFEFFEERKNDDGTIERVPREDEKGNVYVMLGGKRFDHEHHITIEDFEQVDSPLNAMMKHARKAGTIDRLRELHIRSNYTNMMNMFLDMGAGDKGGAINLGKNWQLLAETVFRSVAKNGDDQYSYSVDITKICKKNEAVINAISELQRRQGYGATPAQILDIYMTTHEEGYQAPCPVCYVFSRYIRNGKYASAAINGMEIYGEHLPGGGGEQWDAARWEQELNRITRKMADAVGEEQISEAEINKEIEKALSNANDAVTENLSNIDKLAMQLGIEQNKKNPDKERIQMLRSEIERLNDEYKAANQLVTQQSLSNWIKSFAIQQVNNEWVMREDAAYPTDLEDFKANALDLRLTGNTMVNYPAIQRLRRSGGAAAGKEVTQASNNDLGEIASGINASDEHEYRNKYKEAFATTDKKQRNKLLREANKKFKSSVEFEARQNLRGGQRMWSWSDNIERLSPDVVANLMQLEMLGSGLQSYSKQLEGVELVARMNGYVNGSLMGYGDGFQKVGNYKTEKVDGVERLAEDITEEVMDNYTKKMRTRVLASKGAMVHDVDGEKYVLVYDDIVGIDAHGKVERDENGNLVKTRMGLFDINGELDKAGNILVTLNDMHTRLALADDRVYFIIPWHKSGANNHVLASMYGVLGVKMDVDKVDYTNMQEEKNLMPYTKDGKLVVPEVNERLRSIWNRGREEAERKGWTCGLGELDSDGDKMTEDQMHYRRLRDLIFDGKVKDASKEDRDAIMNDIFLKQVYDAVQGVGGKMTGKDKKFIYPYEYWNTEGSLKDADENGWRYVEYCRRLGYRPKFSGDWKTAGGENKGNFVGDKGYWKLLIDRRMYKNNGEYQGMEQLDSSGYSNDLIDQQKTDAKYTVTRAANEEQTKVIVDKVQQLERERSGEVSVEYGMGPQEAARRYQAVRRGEKYSLSTEIAKKYPNWMDNQVVEDKGENKKRGQNTQIAGTVSTYKKVGDWVEKNLGKGVRVLDASSGLGLGTLELRGRGFNIDDIEPYPGKGRDQQPTYGGVDAYQRAMDDGKEYDYIISNAVLNVIPDDWRAGVLHDMATLLAPGGKMFINTRKAGEEKGIKNKIELESPQEVLVGTPDNITSYQRFFTPKELKEYVERELGDGYTVEVANEANSGTKGLAAVVVTKNNENPDGPQGGKRFSLSPGQQERQTRSDNFKRWFGDWENDPDEASKVVDSDGRPKVVLHGTPNNEFYAFDPEKAGSNTDQGWLGKGFYFYGNAPEYASQYAGKNGRVLKVYLDIKNPYIATVEDFNRLAEANNPEESRRFRERLEEEGYDGVFYNGDLNEEWVAFRPEQIKSATENNGDFSRENPDIRYSLAPTFYSNAAKAVEGVKQNKATAEQWKAMLTKQGGIKAGEDKWMGLSTWLDEHKGETLTKDEVAQFVAENGIEMRETHYGDVMSLPQQKAIESLQKELDEIAERKLKEQPLEPNDAIVAAAYDMAWEELIENHGGDDFNMAFEMEQLPDGTFTIQPTLDWNDEISDAAKHFLGIDGSGNNPEPINTTREGLTTNGLNNKREIVFVVPGVEPYQEHDQIHFGPENQGRQIMWVRFGETTDTEGNRVLVIDEVQSNRHQDAREKGYKRDRKEFDAFVQQMGDKYFDGRKPGLMYNLLKRVGTQEEVDRYKELSTEANRAGIPAAPFEKNWHEVAMKRMLRLAAEEGFDKVAWTTGEQQAERYGLGGIIDSIYIAKSRRDNSKYAITVFDKNADVINSVSKDYTTQELADTFGKDMAQRLIDGEAEQSSGNERHLQYHIEGVDLEVGRDGMKAFYDGILPQFMNKYGKRWGVKVGEVTLDTPGGETMHSVDVNEDMKRSVMENGQPLFSLNGYEPQGGGRAARVQLRKLLEAVAANPGKVEARRVALRELNGQAGALRKAMSKQKEYDRWTVDNLIGLAKEMLNSGLYKGMSPYEVQRLVNMVNQGVGRDDITRQANTVYDIMMKHQVREWENQFDRLLRIRENKIDANGVRVQGALDTHGQRMVQALKSALDLDEETLNERINDCRDRMGSDDNIVAGNAADEMEGLLIAQQHYDSIGRLKKAYDELKQARRTQLEQVYEFWREEKRDEDGNVMYRQDGYPQTVEKRRVRPEFGGVDESGNRRPVSEENKAKRKRVDATVARIEQSMRETQTDMVDAYKEVCDNLGGSVASSITRAKEWVERDKERVGEIHHAANSDLLNVDEKLSGMDRSKEKGLANNAVIRFLNSPLGSFEKFMRYFGQRSAYGEGRLFNKFMRGHSDCTDAEWRAYKEGLDAMNEKSEELFGCSWEKLMVRMRGGAFANTKGKLGIEREFPPIEVSYWVDGKRVDDTLNQDEVAYLIACSKMTDGMMKLENMGIDENMIAQLRQQVDPNMLQLADWYQHEFLPKQRNRINEVYKRMFGADMAHIDNYIHLNINERGLVENKDINQRMAVSETPSTITGSLKERRRNVKPIDLHTSLLDLAMEEHQKMENWIAWAEYNRDLKDLLNYKKFKNKVYNMKSVELGSGEQLWDKFSKAVAVVTGDFQGGGKHSEMDRFATNAAKFVSSGCINFRVHTALKQLLSFPAFMSDARPDDILKAAANPMGSVQWAMENLPGFSKRWESRRVGDTRLMDTDSDYSFWRNRWVQKVNKAGMTANASVDCLTVAVGARAVYETAKRRYMSYGYDEITAERKALQDAYTSYNSSQQSSEGAFTSPMQVERTFLSAIGTTFRNASMGYQRRVTTGARNIARMLKRGYKEDMIENTTKQMMEEGLSEEQARAVAERVYKRQLWHSMMDVANFAYALPFLWILGPTLSYLIAGDDKDIKGDALKDLGRHAVFGSIEGLTFGGVMSELGNMVWNNRAQGNEWKDLWNELKYKDLTPLPLVSRAQGLVDSFGKGWWVGINDLAGLLIQSNVGVDPNTLTDMGVAVLDGCNGDLDTSKEFAFALLRIMQFPQSQIDNLYIDELGLKGKDLGKYSYEELARRYARYKTNRAVLPSVMMEEDARSAAEDKWVTRFEEKVQERIASMDEEEKKHTFGSGDPDLKKMVGKQMAKDAGLDNEKFSKAPASNANERTARAHTTYQRIRDYTDMAEDLLLESEQNKAKEAGDEKRKDEISKARKKLNAIINGEDAKGSKSEVKGLGQGQDEKVLKTLREERRKVLKELGLTR